MDDCTRYKHYQPIEIDWSLLSKIRETDGVYEHQFNDLQTLINNINRREKILAFTKRCMEGKSTIIVQLMRYITDICNKKFEETHDEKWYPTLVWLLSSSDKDLKQQMENHIRNAGLKPLELTQKNVDRIRMGDYEPGWVLFGHMDDVKKIKTNVFSDKNHINLLNLDEAHYYHKKGGVLENFLKLCGMPLGTSPWDWSNKNTFLLNVSATFGVHLLLEDEDFCLDVFGSDDKLAKIVFGSKSDSYYGLDKFIEDGRLNQWDGELWTKEETLSPFIQNQLKELSELPVTRTNGGKAIVIKCLTNIRRYETFVELLKNECDKLGIDLEQFNCGNEGRPLYELSDELGRERRPRHVLVLLKKGASMGKDFPSTKNIHAWIHTSRGKSFDSEIQGIRITGHFKDKEKGRIWVCKNSYENIVKQNEFWNLAHSGKEEEARRMILHGVTTKSLVKNNGYTLFSSNDKITINELKNRFTNEEIDFNDFQMPNPKHLIKQKHDKGSDLITLISRMKRKEIALWILPTEDEKDKEFDWMLKSSDYREGKDLKAFCRQVGLDYRNLFHKRERKTRVDINMERDIWNDRIKDIEKNNLKRFCIVIPNNSFEISSPNSKTIKKTCAFSQVSS